MATDLQFGCFPFVASKQRCLIKVQRERSGRTEMETNIMKIATEHKTKLKTPTKIEKQNAWIQYLC